MRALASAIVAFLVACAAPQTDAQLARVERDVDAFDGRLDDAERVAGELSAAWTDVVSAYRRATADVAIAEQNWRAAAGSYENSAVSYGEATRDYEAAQDDWKFAQEMILAAAVIDAGRARGPASEAVRADCNRVSTGSYRRTLSRQGASLAGRDVDHIVPRSLGGADHPLNYQLLDSSLNRSLGATWSLEKCVLAGRARCAQAVAISMRCGAFRGPRF